MTFFCGEQIQKCNSEIVEQLALTSIEAFKTVVQIIKENFKEKINSPVDEENTKILKRVDKFFERSVIGKHITFLYAFATYSNTNSLSGAIQNKLVEVATELITAINLLGRHANFC